MSKKHQMVTLVIHADPKGGRNKKYFAKVKELTEYLEQQDFTPIQKNKILSLVADSVESAERCAFNEGMDTFFDFVDSGMCEAMLVHLASQGIDVKNSKIPFVVRLAEEDEEKFDPEGFFKVRKG